MNFWETITGSDITREWKAFDVRAEALPADYRSAWGADQRSSSFVLGPHRPQPDADSRRCAGTAGRNGVREAKHSRGAR